MDKLSPEIESNVITEAERSIAQGAYAEARRVLRRFLRLRTSRNAKAVLRCLLGRSYLAEGNWKKAFKELKDAAGAAQRDGNCETAAECHHYLGDCHVYKGDMKAAAGFYRKSMNVCEEENLGGLILAHDISALALINRLDGNYGKALSGWRRAVPIYESIGENLYHADALINCAIMNSFLGDAEAAVSDVQTARSLLSETKHRPRTVDCLWLMGMLLIVNKGDFGGGLDYMEQAVQESVGVGGLEVHRTYSAYSEALMKLGDFGKAKNCAEQALTIARRLNYALGTGSCYLLLSQVRRFESDYVAAEYYAREAKRIFKNSAYVLGMARALVCETETHVHNRRFEKAESALAGAWSVAKETDDIILKSDCAVAETLYLLGQNRTAQEVISKLREFAQKLEGRWWHQELKVKYHLAIALLLEGEEDGVTQTVHEMLELIRGTMSRLPKEHGGSFLRHPFCRGVMELSMRVSFAAALADLRPGDVLDAVDKFRELSSKPQKAPSVTIPKAAPSFELVYDSEQMKEVARTAQRISSSEIPVLVIGETGVGKEMLARYIHHLSERKGQFVALNCAAVPASLMESEMFGYVRGAFSGADTDKKGLLEMAHEGTLFLDEIGNMPPDMQAKLLRALEENRIRPLGSTGETQVNFRLLSATNRDLKEDVGRGRFREDLYYRINVVTIKLPPLRERREDIPVLIEHFLQKSDSQVKMDKDALDILLRYDWPGNVRELKNEIARLVSVSGGAIEKNVLKDEIIKPAVSAPTGGALQDMERKIIEDVLKSTGSNKQKAAKLLGISRTTLYRKMKRHGITCTEP